MHNESIANGDLTVEVVECGRLALVDVAFGVYCTLSVGTDILHVHVMYLHVYYCSLSLSLSLSPSPSLPPSSCRPSSTESAGECLEEDLANTRAHHKSRVQDAKTGDRF